MYKISLSNIKIYPLSDMIASSIPKLYFLNSQPSSFNNNTSISHCIHRIHHSLIELPSTHKPFPSPNLLIRNTSNSQLEPPLNLPSRRNALGLFLLTTLGVVSNPTNPAAAETSKIIKLKNVENQKLQDALRAAVAGDLENAEIMFINLVNEEPGSASLWSNLGSVHVSLGKFEDAASDLTKAIELAPFAPVPYLNRAIAYEALGRFDEAVDDCKKAIENDPQEYAAWFNLGNVQTKLENYEAALKAYERSAVLAPGVAGYRLKQSLLLFQVGRMGEAEKLAAGLVRKYPNYSEAHAVLAAIFWKQGKQSKAEEQFSEAKLLNPVFNNKEFLREQLEWPPRVKQAFQDFLNIV